MIKEALEYLHRQFINSTALEITPLDHRLVLVQHGETVEKVPISPPPVGDVVYSLQALAHAVRHHGNIDETPVFVDPIGDVATAVLGETRDSTVTLEMKTTPAFNSLEAMDSGMSAGEMVDALERYFKPSETVIDALKSLDWSVLTSEDKTAVSMGKSIAAKVSARSGNLPAMVALDFSVYDIASEDLTDIHSMDLVADTTRREIALRSDLGIRQIKHLGAERVAQRLREWFTNELVILGRFENRLRERGGF